MNLLDMKPQGNHLVGYCRCGAPVWAYHPDAGAMNPTCFGHRVELCPIAPQPLPQHEPCK